MTKFISNVSRITHPALVSFYTCVVYFLLKYMQFSVQEKVFVSIQILVITFLFPLLIILLLRSLGHKIDFRTLSLSQKRIAILVQCFIFIILIKRWIILPRYLELHFYYLGSIFSSIIVLLLTFLKLKVSLHMTAMSGLTIFVLGLTVNVQLGNPFLGAFFVFVTGIVAYSRLQTRLNNAKEIWLGMLIGSIPQLLFLYLWL